jgi:DNA-binding XRE family transcriptional regulator
MSLYHTPSISEIKNVRLRSKLSQADCAHYVCVSRETWARWEKGKFPMPAGLWKLFLIELKRHEKKDEDKANEVNNVVDIKQLREDWN